VRLSPTEKVWRILIVDDGFIAVCEWRTISVSMTDAKVSPWCPIESVGVSPLIAVVFEDENFVMVVVLEATVAANAQFKA
jgi:hypothetical protein